MCDRIKIQMPTMFEKNKAPVVPELWIVDEPQLDVVKRGKVKPRNEEGPKKRVDHLISCKESRKLNF